MSSKNHTNIEEITQRLCIELGVKNKTQLANLLGYKTVSGVSNWKTRGIEWKKIHEKFPSLDVNYVKHGREKNENTKRAEEPSSEFTADQLLAEERRRFGIEDIPDTEMGRALEGILDDAVSLALKLRRLTEKYRKGKDSDSS